MNRRNFIQIGIASAGLLNGGGSEAVAASTKNLRRKSGDAVRTKDVIVEATIADLQAMMSAGKLKIAPDGFMSTIMARDSDAGSSWPNRYLHMTLK